MGDLALYSHRNRRHWQSPGRYHKKLPTALIRNFVPAVRQLENLGRMVGYCENKSDCRRVLLLAYLGDEFHRDQCHDTCDTCVAGGTYELKDMTTTAIQVCAAPHPAIELQK